MAISKYKTMEKKQKVKITKRKLYTYSPRKIALAIAEVGNGSSVLASAKKFGIPRETLRGKIRTGTSKVSSFLCNELSFSMFLPNVLFVALRFIVLAQILSSDSILNRSLNRGY